MRLSFSDLSRPKAAARRLAKRSNFKLSDCQRIIAETAGYRDWHDLEQGHAALPPSPLDQDLDETSYRERLLALGEQFNRAQSGPVDDGLRILADLRLVGERTPDLAWVFYQSLKAIIDAPRPPVALDGPDALGALGLRRGQRILLAVDCSATLPTLPTVLARLDRLFRAADIQGRWITFGARILGSGDLAELPSIPLVGGFGALLHDVVEEVRGMRPKPRTVLVLSDGLIPDLAGAEDRMNRRLTVLIPGGTDGSITHLSQEGSGWRSVGIA